MASPAGLSEAMDSVRSRGSRIRTFASPEELASGKNRFHVSLVVSIGGDGALLLSVPRYRAFDAPYLGVNLGAVGFNAGTPPDRLAETLDAWLAGEAPVVDHMALTAILKRGRKEIARSEALNEVVIQRETLARMLQIELRQGAECVIACQSDGLVISTPTGSTAYALSAGGPIVHPTLRAFLVIGLGAYTLSHRPIVLPPSPGLRLTLGNGRQTGPAIIHIDGREHWKLGANDSVEIEASPRPVRLVNPLALGYFETLRHKLHWNLPIKPLAR
jgi:NAD+ kinase